MTKQELLKRVGSVEQIGGVRDFTFNDGKAKGVRAIEINTGKKLPCYISVVTKEDSPEIEVIYIDQTTLDHALNEIELNMQSVLMVKSGEVDPIRCEKCDYCKASKKLSGAINYRDLINE